MATLTGAYQPVMHVTERSELLRAFVTPDSGSGLAKAAEFVANLVRFNSSGSVATVQIVASITATSGAWSPFRAKEMKLVSARVVLEQGDTLALSAENQAWLGVLSLRLRRLL